MRKSAFSMSVFSLGCLLLFALFVPTTGLYKSAVRSLWQHQYYTLGYYLNRDDAELAMKIGNHYFAGGAYDLDKAQKSYAHAIAIDPHIQLAHYQLARIYFVNGDQL